MVDLADITEGADMNHFDAARTVMAELFAKDCVFALATASENKPSVRMTNAYYEDGAFYIVTYAGSAKIKELANNKNVALCSQAYRFDGLAQNIGHPLAPENTLIRKKLIQVFEPWYFRHNDEKDTDMCYVKIELWHGFFYKDGTGYRLDFMNQTVETFPFTLDIILSNDM